MLYYFAQEFNDFSLLGGKSCWICENRSKALEQITLKHFMKRTEHYTHIVFIMKVTVLPGWDLEHLISTCMSYC